MAERCCTCLITKPDGGELFKECGDVVGIRVRAQGSSLEGAVKYRLAQKPGAGGEFAELGGRGERSRELDGEGVHICVYDPPDEFLQRCVRIRLSVGVLLGN